MFTLIIDKLADSLSPALLGKLVLGGGIVLLALAAFGGAQTLRLDAEQSAHQATRATLSGKLALEQSANELLRRSIMQSDLGAEALLQQASACLEREGKREQAAAERAAISASAVSVPVSPVTPQQAQQPIVGQRVLDEASSRAAVEYINRRLREFNGESMYGR